ncbi:hypothetical protein [Haladaptatus sp. CMAA 1911]|uniref:hypothetical protein n=1 Tax=unclassified Haladaptatus TaxID=2622732 RepID=UPI003753F4CC
MATPSGRVLGLFAFLAVFHILLQLDYGNVVSVLALVASYSVLLWGLWKHKNGELFEG